jgi:hypothetical protein
VEESLIVGWLNKFRRWCDARADGVAELGASSAIIADNGFKAESALAEESRKG